MSGQSQVNRCLRLLQRIAAEVNNPEVTFTYQKAAADLEETERLFQKAEAITDSLVSEATTLEEEKIHQDLMDKVYDVWRNLKVDLSTILHEVTPSMRPPPQQSQPQASGIKLPKIDAPRFGGDFAAWPSFKDLFEAAVGRNTTLTDGQKLQYLKSVLSGKPLQLIQEFSINDANYKGAWALLNERYNNKWDIASTYLRRFIGLKPVICENADGLCNLMDSTVECFQQLGTMNLTNEEQLDLLKVTMTLDRMDGATKREWIKQQDGVSIPTFEDLKKFTLRYVSGLRATQKNSTTCSQPKKNNDGARVHHGEMSQQCHFCSENHPHYRCPVLNGQKDVQSRRDMVSAKGLCWNCLNTGHVARDCRSMRCRFCGQKHHSLLHSHEQARVGPSSRPIPLSTPAQHIMPAPRPNKIHVVSNKSPPPTQDQVLNHHTEASSHVLLQTAVVDVPNYHDQQVPCRLFLDNGSQACLITERCAQLLGFKRKWSSMQIKGIGGASVQANGRFTIALISRDGTKRIDVEVHVLPRITNDLPKVPVDVSKFTHLANIPLADPEYFKPAEIDILIGAEFYALLMLDGKITGPPGTPVAQNTLFGWVVSGPAPIASPIIVETYHAECEWLKKFWEVEEPPKVKFLTEEEKLCEEHFLKTYYRNPDGRYVVRVPFKPSKINMGASRDQAIRRFQQTEKKITKNPNLFKQYSDFIKEYEDLGHMRKVILPVAEVPGKTYYFPHHAVINESSTTTKLRVVFDGSASSANGLSFNDVVYTGATLQDDLYDHLLRFRTHKIVLKADIAKMFRQFLLHEDDVPMHRIVWRDLETRKLVDYELLTITYGTACAPNLATRSLQQLAKDVQTEYPQASAVLLRDMYVDDLMTGVSSFDDAKTLYSDLTCAVTKGKLSLRKWSSNSKELLKLIPPEDCDTDPASFDESNLIKALGVQWCPSTDCFTFKYNDVLTSGPVTKRQLYSDLAKAYDPLGLISPVILRGKILLQELRKLDIGWDDEIPYYVNEAWIAYREDLSKIPEFKIPRHIYAYDFLMEPEATFELHGFGDASEKAYGAVLYIRSLAPTRLPVVRLITSKTRVAPLKQLPLPRLELLASLLLSEMTAYVKDVLQLDCELHLWTDSMITLKWISAEPRRWKTFVANRVAQIQSLTPVKAWHHVPGLENPADLASRGCTAAEMIANTMWTKGPNWLQEFGTPTFISHSTALNPADLEEKPNLTHAVEKSGPFLMDRFSSLVKAKRVIARILRWKSKAKGPLQPEELETSLLYLVRITQAFYFGDEISSLKTKKPVPTKSKLKSLYPYLDNLGILRVAGRLTNANLPEDSKHQIILPANCDLVKQLVRYYHLGNLHSGFNLTWATLQQKFWIIGGRDLVRNQLRSCITCKKWKAEEAQQLMGVLPPCRVNPARPFMHSGVDFAGPFIFKNPIGRAPKTYKGYMCIFVCMSTKAVHLEAVTGLTTAEFLATLRRFTSRRGLPSNIYSDNGTNFVGAEKELQKLFEDETFSNVQGSLADDGIKWTFIPPSAPHFGGIWEAGVKSAKYHLRRIVGDKPMTYADFSTLLCQVEAVLNSRPLSPFSPDPDDARPLTPGHFLVGGPLNQLPDRNLLDMKMNRLEHFQRIQQQVQHFWKRWVAEYLNTLQQRNKWWWEQPNLKEGQLVLIKEDNLAPGKWIVGRIIEALHSPEDNLVRKVVIRTPTTTLERPIVKCIPLLDP